MPSPNWSQRALASIFAPDPAASDQTLPQPGLLTGPAEPIVVPAGSGFGVSVKPGAWILAGAAPATVGSVLWAPPGYVGVTLAAANPTLPRNDLITIQVTDPGSSSAAGSSDVIVVQGIAASSPTDPTVPTGALVIARVVVRAGTSSIVQNDITNFPLQTGLRSSDPAPGWEITGLDASFGGTSYLNNTATSARLRTIVEATNVTVDASPASATIQVPGNYTFDFHALFAPGGSIGPRQAQITVNRGSTALRRFYDGSGAENGYVYCNAHCAKMRLRAGDLVFATVLQISGGTLLLDDTNLVTHFSGYWLGP